MFETWGDVWTALAVLVVVNLLTTRYARVREALLPLRRDEDDPLVEALLATAVPGAEPFDIKLDDESYSIIGQERSDYSRLRRMLAVAVALVVLFQLVRVNGYVAAAAVLGPAAVLDAAFRGYDRLMTRMMNDEAAFQSKSLVGELIVVAGLVLAPLPTNPLRGRWRPLGLVAAAVTVAVALSGWVTLLSAFGVDFRDIGDPVGDALGTRAWPVLAVAGAALLAMARLPLELARRLALARPGASGSYDIVYLRSFKDDRLSIRAAGGTSRSFVDRLTLHHRHGYERLIVAVARDLGRVVAIGEPGERIPPSGAFRVYYRDDEWQGAVERMLLDATFIVLSVGETPSVGWEIRKLRDLGLLDHTLFLIPPVPYEARQQRLQLLIDQLELPGSFLEGLGSDLAHVGVRFEDGLPVVIGAPAPSYAAYMGAMVGAAFDHFDTAKHLSTPTALMPVDGDEAAPGPHIGKEPPVT